MAEYTRSADAVIWLYMELIELLSVALNPLILYVVVEYGNAIPPTILLPLATE